MAKPVPSVVEPRFRQQWREHGTRYIWRVTRVWDAGTRVEIWSPYTGQKRKMLVKTFQAKFRFELPAPRGSQL